VAETTRRFFPYDSPYPNQGEAMTRIAAALDDGDDVLFEGAPGTGKTLSALVPALEHAREEDRTVVITTNVHQQMRQFVEEARAINEEEDIRAVVFKGKTTRSSTSGSTTASGRPRRSTPTPTGTSSVATSC